MSWQREEEILLAAIGDRCNGYQWLHVRSQIYFENWNFYLTIPSIILSAITGSVTIGLTSLFPEPQIQGMATTVIGAITIGSGVMTTVNQYMKTASLAEAHRAASLSYGKLYRLILTELSMRREQRQEATAFLKMVRTEQDRLQEMSPSISPHIIDQFNRLFKDNKLLEKPEITGDMDHIVMPLLTDVSCSPMRLRTPLSLVIDVSDSHVPVKMDGWVMPTQTASSVAKT